MIKGFFYRLSNFLSLRHIKSLWRKRNKHNFTVLTRKTDINCISVGNYTYGKLTIYNSSNLHCLKIGNYCSIADDVVFLLCVDHPLNLLSTYPFKKMILHNGEDSISKGDITIDDDVWIGERATILSGVHIGKGAVIGACALVTKDVPPYAIVGGVPAKIIKFRFDEETIKTIINFDFNSLTKELINEKSDYLYKKINDVSDIDWILESDHCPKQ